MTSLLSPRERGDLGSVGTAARHRLAVSIAFFANGLMIGSWAPQIPLFAGRLGLSAAEMGLMILAFGIGAVAAMPMVGRVIGSQGSRPPMIALHIALILALPALVFAPTVPLAVLAIVFAGITTGGMDVAMNANAVSVEERRHSAIMSSCHGCWSIGGLVGASSGGLLIAAVGAEAHGLLVGAATLLGLLPVLRFALSDKPQPQASRGPVADAPVRPGVVSGYRGAVLVGVVALFAMIPEGAAIDWSAYYLRQELGTETAASGLAFAAFSLTMAIFRFAGDGVRNRLGPVLTMRLCSGAAIIGLLVVGLAPNALVAIAGFAVMGVGISNIVPIAFSAAGKLGGLKPGAGLSVVTTFGYSGILVAPSAIGYLGEHVGFAPVFLGLSALLVVTLLAAPVMRVAE